MFNRKKVIKKYSKNLHRNFIKRGGGGGEAGGQRQFINFIKKTEEMVKGAFPIGRTFSLRRELIFSDEKYL